MADKEELFDLVDEQDNVIGTELRSVVHSKGASANEGTRCGAVGWALHWLWCHHLCACRPLRPAHYSSSCYKMPLNAAGLLHRAVYVWVFRPDGALLVQRRSPHKKIGPGQLDLSVAEHLQPGENYLQVGAWDRRIAACGWQGARVPLCRCTVPGWAARGLQPSAHTANSPALPASPGCGAGAG